MSNRTLVTFLGRSQSGGYRTATYRFPDGSETETAFFGIELAKKLKVTRLVILGTSGSGWSVLVEEAAKGSEHEDSRIKLLEAEADNNVDKERLEELAPLMTRWAGSKVEPRLIPYGKDSNEQQDILKTIAEAVKSGKVYFDVTHGFRHLSMLSFVSAFMLERLHSELQVSGIWYGAFEMTKENVTPAIKLVGLIHVQRWVDALSRFDASGDYGVFTNLLIEDGVDKSKANLLHAAAHFERVSNLNDARKKIKSFLPILDSPLSGASEMFRKQLKERLKWANEGSLAENQKTLAYTYLKRKDFIRAAQFALEALISRKCNELGEPDTKHKNRDKAKKSLNESANCSDEPLSEYYKQLNALRNMMSHGTKPEQPKSNRNLKNDNSDYVRILKNDNPDYVAGEFKKIFDKLL